MLDLQNIRAQFPILEREINGKPLIYLDNAATSQKPKMVLDALQNYYTDLNANVHRGIHTLSQLATVEMENARVKIQKFINAKHDYEINFTRGTTMPLEIPIG
jgi:cysteine desulfurase/selenocysteine lyase